MIRYLLVLLALLTPLNAHATEYEVTSIDGTFHIKTERYAEITGSIAEPSAFIFGRQMIETLQYEGDRLIVINSDGGYLDSSESILQLIDNEKRADHRIVCVVDHEASSMAFNILSRCDVRAATPKSHLMFHPIARGILLETDEVRLTPKYLRLKADELEREDSPYKRLNMKLLNLSLKDYEMYADQNHTWTADALIKRGYLNYLVTIKKH